MQPRTAPCHSNADRREDGNQLRSREGKEALRTRPLASVQGQLKELTGETLVSDLFFTNYYVK